MGHGAWKGDAMKHEASVERGGGRTAKGDDERMRWDSAGAV